MKTEDISSGRLAVRAFGVWLVIITAESVHGMLRMTFLEPLVGDFQARQLAVFTAMLIIFGITYAFIDRLRPSNRRRLLTVGILWLFWSLVFEISLGRLIGLSWERIFADYNLARGGLMPLGLIFIVFAPLLAAKLRGGNSTVTRPEDSEARPKS